MKTYWFVPRENLQRLDYIELVNQGDKWRAVIDYHEFTFRLDNADFYDALHYALTVYRTQLRQAAP